MNGPKAFRDLRDIPRRIHGYETTTRPRPDAGKGAPAAPVHSRASQPGPPKVSDALRASRRLTLATLCVSSLALVVSVLTLAKAAGWW